MASAAHCAFCFEVLAASLEDRETLQFNAVLQLWRQYESATSKGTSSNHADQGVADTTESNTNEGPIGAQDDVSGLTLADSKKGGVQLPSISRLQASSPASASSSSSTPASLSTSSSAAALGDKSKSSSNSSFFSFGRSKQPSPLGDPPEEEHPLFVTWNTLSSRSGHKSLRGCIGTFEAQVLSSGLQSYALTAAFDDTRFAPISLSELRSLSTSVTLLTAFEPCKEPFDWEIGIHGIRISFSSHGKRYGATYLPDVAVEQGWNKEECLISLMRKAGWNGRRSEWRDVKALTVVRYEGKKASLDYADWKRWRDWVKSIL